MYIYVYENNRLITFILFIDTSAEFTRTPGKD